MTAQIPGGNAGIKANIPRKCTAFAGGCSPPMQGLSRMARFSCRVHGGFAKKRLPGLFLMAMVMS